MSRATLRQPKKEPAAFGCGLPMLTREGKKNELLETGHQDRFVEIGANLSIRCYDVLLRIFMIRLERYARILELFDNSVG